MGMGHSFSLKTHESDGNMRVGGDGVVGQKGEGESVRVKLNTKS